MITCHRTASTVKQLIASTVGEYNLSVQILANSKQKVQTGTYHRDSDGRFEEATD